MSGPRWNLNLDWVMDGLAVGGSFPIEAAGHLSQALGIGHIVDLRREMCDDEHILREHGICLLHLPTLDLHGVQRGMLADGVAWVTGRLARGHKVYIHCEYGIGRSATLALCVMVALGHSPLEALRRLKAARWQVAPSLTQLAVFREWAGQWRTQRGLNWPMPTVGQLVSVVEGTGGSVFTRS